MGAAKQRYWAGSKRSPPSEVSPTPMLVLMATHLSTPLLLNRNRNLLRKTNMKLRRTFKRTCWKPSNQIWIPLLGRTADFNNCLKKAIHHLETTPTTITLTLSLMKMGQSLKEEVIKPLPLRYLLSRKKVIYDEMFGCFLQWIFHSLNFTV